MHIVCDRVSPILEALCMYVCLCVHQLKRESRIRKGVAGWPGHILRSGNGG